MRVRHMSCAQDEELPVDELLTIEQLAKFSVPAPRHAAVSGIYFLFNAGRVIYVGRSGNVASRIGSHTADKVFDRYAVIPCDEINQCDLETAYIFWLRPPLNGTKVCRQNLYPEGIRLIRDSLKNPKQSDA